MMCIINDMEKTRDTSKSIRNNILRFKDWRSKCTQEDEGWLDENIEKLEKIVISLDRHDELCLEAGLCVQQESSNDLSIP
jgi:hypothetical protein